MRIERLIKTRAFLLFCWILANIFSPALSFYSIDVINIALMKIGIVVGFWAFLSFYFSIGLIQSLVFWQLGVKKVLLWFLATTFACFIAALAGFLYSSAFNIFFSEFWIYLLMGMVIGSFIGFFQWLILRNEYHHAKFWILANICGYGLGFAVAWGIDLNTIDDNIGRSVVMGLISSSTTGIALWKILENPKISSQK